MSTAEWAVSKWLPEPAALMAVAAIELAMVMVLV